MLVRSILSAAVLLGLAACESDPPAPVADNSVAEVAEESDDYAVAQIEALDGSGVSGTVTFQALGDDGVQIDFDIEGLGAGDHGFHVHETGDCGPDSTGTPGGAAGGHFNPMESPHGGPDSTASQRHAGDLGNIRVSPSSGGVARGSRVDSVLAFGGPTNVVGKSVIVHAGADDLSSGPSGDAGARIGCGVIRAADRPVLPADTLAASA